MATPQRPPLRAWLCPLDTSWGRWSTWRMGPRGGAVVATVARPAAEQTDGSVTTVARPTALPTDVRAVGGATVATPAAASTARRAHGLAAIPRRAGSAPLVAVAKHVPRGFSVCWGRNQILRPRGETSFVVLCRARQCELV